MPELAGVDLVFVGPEIAGKGTGKLRFRDVRETRGSVHAPASPFRPLAECAHGPRPLVRAAFYKGTLQVPWCA